MHVNNRHELLYFANLTQDHAELDVQTTIHVRHLDLILPNTSIYVRYKRLRSNCSGLLILLYLLIY